MLSFRYIIKTDNYINLKLNTLTLRNSSSLRTVQKRIEVTGIRNGSKKDKLCNG